jgi:hypothetical protein
MESAMWGSPLWFADGKVYVTDEDGDVRIFEDVKDKMKLYSSERSPTWAARATARRCLRTGSLYITDAGYTVYAIANGAQATAVAIMDGHG